MFHHPRPTQLPVQFRFSLRIDVHPLITNAARKVDPVAIVLWAPIARVGFVDAGSFRVIALLLKFF
jgi:hypothetical protein